MPLVEQLPPICKHAWVADDASGCDELTKLKKWYDDLLTKVSSYGYYPNPSKCILVVKAEKLEQAKLLFKGMGVDITLDGSKDTGIEINTQGARHLGATAGSLDFKRIYVKNKINNWIELVKQLALIAKTEPHAAFVAYTHSLQCQWTFISRVMDGIADLFEP